MDVTLQVEPQGTAELPAASKALFLETVRESNLACQSGDFARAVALYSEALRLDPANQVPTSLSLSLTLALSLSILISNALKKLESRMYLSIYYSYYYEKHS